MWQPSGAESGMVSSPCEVGQVERLNVLFPDGKVFRVSDQERKLLESLGDAGCKLLGSFDRLDAGGISSSCSEPEAF